jgi:hypothetical protein
MIQVKIKGNKKILKYGIDIQPYIMYGYMYEKENNIEN